MLFNSLRFQVSNSKLKFGFFVLNKPGVVQSIYKTSRSLNQGNCLSVHCHKKNLSVSSLGSESGWQPKTDLGSSLKVKIFCAKFSSSTRFSVFWRMGDQMSQEVSGLQDTTTEERPGKVKLTDAEWKEKLTPEEYSVCRKHGTERAWTGALLDNKQKGTYTCSNCGVDLFSSSTKFDSGSGWPSFYDVLKDKDVSRLPAVDIKQDRSYGMTRTEVLCGKCSSHLGHVFNDGPKPTGLRYCINSVSLKFKKENDGSNNNKNNL